MNKSNLKYFQKLKICEEVMLLTTFVLIFDLCNNWVSPVKLATDDRLLVVANLQVAEISFGVEFCNPLVELICLDKLQEDMVNGDRFEVVTVVDELIIFSGELVVEQFMVEVVTEYTEEKVYVLIVTTKYNSFSGELVVEEFMLVVVMAKLLEENEIAMMGEKEKVDMFTVMAMHISCMGELFNPWLEEAKHNSFSGELVVEEFMLVVVVMAKLLAENEIANLGKEKVDVFTVMAKHNSCT